MNFGPIACAATTLRAECPDRARTLPLHHQNVATPEDLYVLRVNCLKVERASQKRLVDFFHEDCHRSSFMRELPNHLANIHLR